jgi:hypothetical protein
MGVEASLFRHFLAQFLGDYNYLLHHIFVKEHR